MITNGAGKPVVALDIDGTLGNYQYHFIRFAEEWFGVSFLYARTEDNPGKPLWEHMGVDHRLYQDCKLAYRQGGQKRSMPAYGGSSRLTRHIQEAGAEVWLCTTRPYLRMDNVDPDTREWLRRNAIKYDALIFDRVDDKWSKYEVLKEQAGERVCLIAEDLPELVDIARAKWPVRNDVGFQTTILLRDQPYNRYRDLSAAPTYARRVFHAVDIENAAIVAIEKWMEENGKF